MSFKKKRMARSHRMIQKAAIVSIKLAREQTFEEICFSLHFGFIFYITVVVEGLKIVECARVVVQQISKERWPTSPGGCNDNLPCRVYWYFLTNPEVTNNIHFVSIGFVNLPHILFYIICMNRIFQITELIIQSGDCCHYAAFQLVLWVWFLDQHAWSWWILKSWKYSCEYLYMLHSCKFIVPILLQLNICYDSIQYLKKNIIWKQKCGIDCETPLNMKFMFSSSKKLLRCNLNPKSWYF